MNKKLIFILVALVLCVGAFVIYKKKKGGNLFGKKAEVEPVTATAPVAPKAKKATSRKVPV